MRLYTALWIAWAIVGLLVEASAIHGRTFENTLSGHLVGVMRASPWLAWLVPTLVVGLAIHLMLEAFRT